MRRILILSALMIPVLFGSNPHAGSLPLLELKEGTNEVSISVVNKGWIDLNSITVVVNEERLPEWLRIEESPQRISVPKMSRGSEKLILRVEVRDAPERASFELPLALRDGDGRSWHFRALAQVTSSLPASSELFQNYPNPFNPTTTIRYSLVGEGLTDTRLVVFDVLGQKVRTLVDELQAPGFYTVVWDGRDDEGNKVSSGTYFYKLISGNFEKVRRMMLVE